MPIPGLTGFFPETGYIVYDSPSYVDVNVFNDLGGFFYSSVTIVVENTTTVSSSDATIAAMDLTGFGPGVAFRILLDGHIRGAGGLGGSGWQWYIDASVTLSTQGQGGGGAGSVPGAGGVSIWPESPSLPAQPGTEEIGGLKGFRQLTNRAPPFYPNPTPPPSLIYPPDPPWPVPAYRALIAPLGPTGQAGGTALLALPSHEVTVELVGTLWGGGGGGIGGDAGGDAPNPPGNLALPNEDTSDGTDGGGAGLPGDPYPLGGTGPPASPAEPGAAGYALKGTSIYTITGGGNKRGQEGL